jgi:membrane associated rhomboid family serine protease
MGLRDRDYTQRNSFDDRKRRPRRVNGRSIAVTFIFINIALWLANGILFSENNWLTYSLLLREEYAWSLLSCYRFLTYGFAHSSSDWTHIAFNMFGLLMFGYGMMLGIGPGGFGFVRSDNVEGSLGRLEFAAFYLLTIIAGGIVFALINFGDAKASVLGASGGVCGVIVLYAWMFPNKTLLLWGILPMPMWGIGMLIVVMDAWGAAGGLGGGIAYSVHLAGAACGTAYYFFFLKQRRKLTDWLDPAASPKRKPKLHIHTPEDTTSPSTPNSSATEDEFSRRLDEILKRYGEVGESGLTTEEREFLQRASRKFSDKHRK